MDWANLYISDQLPFKLPVKIFGEKILAQKNRFRISWDYKMVFHWDYKIVFQLKFGIFSEKRGNTYIVDEKVIIENRKCISSNSEFANLFLPIKTILLESFIKHWNISSRDVERFPILNPSCIETDTC